MEIGSEFQYETNADGEGIMLPEQVKDYAFVFSGRTAIETILKNEPNIRKAMLPSYCCDSMVEPFRKADIDVCFFSVKYDAGLQIQLNIPEDVDCLLWCNYFGYKNDMPDMSKFTERGGIVIEDITHSFFSIKQYHSQSDYLVASIRKWVPLLCGGYCASLKRKLQYIPIMQPSDEFLQKKRSAMIFKREYLLGNKKIDKNDFLNKFFSSNRWIAENYSNLSIDPQSERFIETMDFTRVRKKRIRNAKILHKDLIKNQEIQILFDEKQMDCPLFVPILVKKRQRDLIRKRLIDNQIYCPIHWPKPDMDCDSNLYDCELSLICDQRYGDEDMKKIVTVLLNI